ncbi:hypothetical protein [Streptomyces sp. SP18CS02]|uniref:hypothetical protein n=1 Tax=Streptomyces sp. SP18CS02 TaxID=3002531 RepID=UPI002E784904|nr:hypothetical protein [Streptomyces sp. SP18CS02]MEE1751521.1 hypothetical protein [Streptomyces sp. SP18CS02]
MVGPDEETVIPAIRRTLTAAAVVTAVLSGSAACGTVENLTAGQKLDRAFDRIGKERSVSVELDLDADAGSLKALDAEAEPGEEIPDEVAELISGARISLSVQSTKPLDESDEKDLTGLAMKVSSPDGDLFEYRVVGDHTYLRADVKAVAEMAGQPMPSAEELPESAEAFKKFLNGEWLKIATKDWEEVREGMGMPGSGAAGPSAEPSLDADTQKKLLESLREVVAREVDFTSTGGKDGVEHIAATAPFRTLITELVDELRRLSKDLPPGMELPTAQELKDAPDKPVTADFTLKNGALSELSLDLTKLAENAEVKKFALVMRLGKGDKVAAPSGAAAVDVDELMEGVFGGASPAGFPEEDLGDDASA